ncbi:MAG: hypothetical protein KDB03_11645 [Planctomycetales bacterium]|nr:hypothetical protein [Planctomycetales bacterium]
MGRSSRALGVKSPPKPTSSLNATGLSGGSLVLFPESHRLARWIVRLQTTQHATLAPVSSTSSLNPTGLSGGSLGFKLPSTLSSDGQSISPLAFLATLPRRDMANGV